MRSHAARYLHGWDGAGIWLNHLSECSLPLGCDEAVPQCAQHLVRMGLSTLHPAVASASLHNTKGLTTRHGRRKGNEKKQTL